MARGQKNAASSKFSSMRFLASAGFLDEHAPIRAAKGSDPVVGFPFGVPVGVSIARPGSWNGKQTFVVHYKCKAMVCNPNWIKMVVKAPTELWDEFNKLTGMANKGNMLEASSPVLKYLVDLGRGEHVWVYIDPIHTYRAFDQGPAGEAGKTVALRC
jgi:hypothetical protein